MAKLDGKVALITGGTTGIGAATAKLFRGEGALVIVTGSKAETVENVNKELPGVSALVSDQADIASIERLMANISAKYGRIDILIVNAGIGKLAPVDQVTEEMFDGTFGVNIRGAFFTVKHALPLMSEGGSIIFTGSVGGKLGIPGMSVYSATKAAIRSLTRTLASELAPRGIRVNTVVPGPIDTPIFGKTGLPKKDTDQFLQHQFLQMPIARIGRPEEVAGAILYLAADATFTTAGELVVDGGLTDT